MANYCGNKLLIKSDDSVLIDELVEIANPPKRTFLSKLLPTKPVQRDYGLLGFFCPMPELLKKTITNGWSGPQPQWNKWQIENWGCAYDVAVESTERMSDNEVRFKFQSRYSPPLSAVEHGAKKHGFHYRLVYCETGSQFAGVATELDHTEFEFTFAVHPRDEGVPQEIIDEFQLVSIYQEMKEDEAN